jgi:thiosulfate reductase cytochrome b subunit
MLFAQTALLGWAATLLLVAGACIPYLVRARIAPASPGRLRPHFWIGFLILAAAFAHAWLPMSAGHMRGYDMAGLLIASLALGAMICQVALGVVLRTTRGPERNATKRVHFLTMAAIALLVTGHIVLNRQ